MTIAKALDKVYKTQTFIDSIKRALDFAPELKHENQFSTEISTHLNSSTNLRSEREIRTSKYRRVDLRVGDDLMEAKYHYEGDIDQIGTALHKASNDQQYLQKLLDQKYQSAPKDMVQQATRNDAQWLLWFVAVRDPGVNAPYRLPKLIETYYKNSKAKDLQAAHFAAADQMSTIAKKEFAKLRSSSINPILLPTIEAKKGALVSLLVPLPQRRVPR